MTFEKAQDLLMPLVEQIYSDFDKLQTMDDVKIFIANAVEKLTMIENGMRMDDYCDRVRELQKGTVKISDIKKCWGSDDVIYWSIFKPKYRNALKKALKNLGCEKDDFIVNVHQWDFSGYFKVGGQCYYFRIDDVRQRCKTVHSDYMLVRKCKDFDDTHGEENHFLEYTDDVFEKAVKELR